MINKVWMSGLLWEIISNIRKKIRSTSSSPCPNLFCAWLYYRMPFLTISVRFELTTFWSFGGSFDHCATVTAHLIMLYTSLLYQLKRTHSSKTCSLSSRFVVLSENIGNFSPGAATSNIRWIFRPPALSSSSPTRPGHRSYARFIPSSTDRLRDICARLFFWMTQVLDVRFRPFLIHQFIILKAINLFFFISIW